MRTPQRLLRDGLQRGLGIALALAALTAVGCEKAAEPTSRSDDRQASPSQRAESIGVIPDGDPTGFEQPSDAQWLSYIRKIVRHMNSPDRYIYGEELKAIGNESRIRRQITFTPRLDQPLPMFDALPKPENPPYLRLPNPTDNRVYVRINGVDMGYLDPDDAWQMPVPPMTVHRVDLLIDEPDRVLRGDENRRVFASFLLYIRGAS